MITKHIKKRLKENVSLYKKTGKEYYIEENVILIQNAYSNGYISGRQARKWLYKYVESFTGTNHLWKI